MTTGKIDRLSPQNHGITLRRGTQRATPVTSGMLLNEGISLLMPGGRGRTARIYFVDAAGRQIDSYRIVVASGSREGQYQVPCTVSGFCTIAWDNNRSGCRVVRVRGAASAAGTSIPRPTAKPSASSPTKISPLANPAPRPDQHDAIQFLIERGIITGYRGSRIEPNKEITREEFASMIAAANLYWKIPETNRTIAFVDIAPNRWSRPAIEITVRTGFLTGYPGNQFMPTQPLAREVGLASLVGGLGLRCTIPDRQQYLKQIYRDAETISKWAQDAIAAATQTGIVIQSGDGLLKPRQTLNRAEAALLIHQALVYKEGSKNLQVFEDPEILDPDDQLPPGPEVLISPQTSEITLVQTNSLEDSGAIQISSLTARVNVEVPNRPELKQYLDFGQRYTYRPVQDGGYRGFVSVISRQEREAIANSEEVQSLIDGWSAEASPLPKGIYQSMLANRLLTKTPIQTIQTTVAGIPLWQVTINLSDPDTVLTLGLGNGAAQEGDSSYRAEAFDNFVRRHQGAAVVTSGTFANANTNELYGNMIANGQFLRYKDWELEAASNRGTVLLLGEGNRPLMLTSDAADDQAWKDAWREAWFYLTAGPRLVRAGNIALNPGTERFAQPDIVNVNLPAKRSAIGVSEDRRLLYIVTPAPNVSLTQLATVMKAIGCHDAMNLASGASPALAVDGQVKVSPSRPLTHALVVYDVTHPAPPELLAAWNQYQKGDRRPQPVPSQPPAPTPPTPPSPPSGDLNARIMAAVQALGQFSSKAGPSNGNEACGWAVNHVLQTAGIAQLGSNPYLVSAVEATLKGGRGSLINPPTQAQPGDIVIKGDQGHMGICIGPIGPNQVRSNSSSKTAFRWDSDINFDMVSRAYRLKPGNLNAQIKRAVDGLSLNSSQAPSEDQAPVWAVNEVLKTAGIPLLAPNQMVKDVETVLINGRGTLISQPNQIQPGDIIIQGDQRHMGICMGSNQVRSYWYDTKTFSWNSDLHFSSRVYRLQS